MQFLKINESTTLQSLASMVGSRNVSSVLAVNNLNRTPNVGRAYAEKCNEVDNDTDTVSWQRKYTLLNTLVDDEDVFEFAALADEKDWKVLSKLGGFSGMLKLPETVKIPDSVDVIGNGNHISRTIYRKAMKQITDEPHEIDPAIFNEYSSIKNSKLDGELGYENNLLYAFNLPWGKITLYSSLGRSSMDIPAYPEELDDQRTATYSTMPDMIYQFEPWIVYQSSGPRSNTYKFHLHRDMWTGDHRDGRANELIRFCEANCYPEYNGSLVNTSIVTLFIMGQPHIRGVITSVGTHWSGPIGLDGYYLEFELSLTIQEVSEKPLSYSEVKNKKLIGG